MISSTPCPLRRSVGTKFSRSDYSAVGCTAVFGANFLEPVLVGSKENDVSIVDLIPALRAFARTFCPQESDADDLVQETLAKAIANIDKFEPGTRMKSWLFTIMRNTFCTRIKAYRREAPGLMGCASERQAVESAQEWSVRCREVRAAINMLPRHQREVLVLIGVLGVSYDEAADICGCAIGTIKSRLSRARVGLLEILGETSSQMLVEGSVHLQRGFLIPESASRD
jgi:RNA polymerase sigma factor (sigma-70 family)